MGRLMSVAFTEQAVVERRKTVTRRKGWLFLKPGDRLTLVRKAMGRRRPDGTVEPLVRLAEVEVVSVRREPLGRLLEEDGDGLPTAYAHDEVRREGFVRLTPEDFVDRYFIKAQRIYPDHEITRIEWRYLNGESS